MTSKLRKKNNIYHKYELPAYLLIPIHGDNLDAYVEDGTLLDVGYDCYKVMKPITPVLSRPRYKKNNLRLYRVNDAWVVVTPTNREIRFGHKAWAIEYMWAFKQYATQQETEVDFKLSLTEEELVELANTMPYTRIGRAARLIILSEEHKCLS